MKKYNRILGNNNRFQFIGETKNTFSQHEKISYCRTHLLKSWQMQIILNECDCFINKPGGNITRKGNIIKLKYPGFTRWYKAL